MREVSSIREWWVGVACGGGTYNGGVVTLDKCVACKEGWQFNNEACILPGIVTVYLCLSFQQLIAQLKATPASWEGPLRALTYHQLQPSSNL